MSNLRDEMEKAAGEYGLGGGSNDMFQFKKSGKYTLRILTKPLAIATHFFGPGQPSSVCFGADKGCPFHKEGEKTPSLKFVCYLICRETGKLQLGEIPWSVVARLADLEEDDDWAFDKYPMPYDIRVNYDKENKDPKEMYKMISLPKREGPTDQEMGELAGRLGELTPEDYIKRRKAKASDKLGGSQSAQEAPGGAKPPRVDNYPKMDETNDASGLPDIE